MAIFKIQKSASNLTLIVCLFLHLPIYTGLSYFI